MSLDDGGKVSIGQEATGFTDEDLNELNEVIALSTTRSVEQISELYKSPNSFNNNEFCDKMENGMHKVDFDDFSRLVPLSVENFLNREELVERVRNVGLIEGYSLTIRRSKNEKYVIIRCDRSGTYRNNVPDDKRKRASASRLINGPFEVWGKNKFDGCWKLEIKNLYHNHEPSSDMSGHPYYRRLSEEDKMRIKEMTKAGITPRQMISSMRQNNPDFRAVARTVYNAKAAIIREELGGRTMIEALFEEFGQGDFTFDIHLDGNGHLTHLFFAHPSSIALTKSYPYVFVMDCTYKTNKYKMPLLNIVGVSSFNGSFYSCFAFIQKEKEHDYVWALERFRKILGDEQHPLVIVSDRELALMNAIKVIFPRTAHILCVWHIEKNMLSKCKPHFGEEADWKTFLSAWTFLIESSDESSFDEAWHLFQVQYKEREFALNYIRSNWLPFKRDL